MELHNNIAVSKLEIISMLLSIEDAEILRKISTIINKAKHIEENEKITLISYSADTMNKTQFLTWLKECEDREMLTKEEFNEEFDQWMTTTKGR
jgi:hypothetical protein